MSVENNGVIDWNAVLADLEAKKSALEQTMLDNILSDHGRIGTILKERTSLAETQIPELFREAQTKDAAFAVGCGIVHEIRDIQIPTGSTVISLVFQR